jgi:gentisate 1,2-dioxygenase
MARSLDDEAWEAFDGQALRFINPTTRRDE